MKGIVSGLALGACLLVSCNVPKVGDGSTWVPTADPATCPMWRSTVAPLDFDAVCNPEGADLRQMELAMWHMINADRVEHAEEANGAPPLAFDCSVAEVARLHSYAQCVVGEMTHVLDGFGPSDRIRQGLGLRLGYDYATVGENVAWGWDVQGTEDAFVELEPPCDADLGGHRLNILNRDYRYVGVGFCACTLDETGNFYVTQNFITFDPAQVTGSNPYCETLAP